MDDRDDLNGRLERAGQRASLDPDTDAIVERGKALRRRRKYIAVGGGTVAVAAVIAVGMVLIQAPGPQGPADVGSSPEPSSAPPSEPADDSLTCPPPQVEAGYLPWDMSEGGNPPSHVEREGKVADVYWFPSKADKDFKGAYVHLRRYPYGGSRWGEKRQVQGTTAALQPGPTAEAAIYWNSGGDCGHYSVFVDLDRSGGTKEQAADYAYRVADSLWFGE